jgi:hypothetical protein
LSLSFKILFIIIDSLFLEAASSKVLFLKKKNVTKKNVQLGFVKTIKMLKVNQSKSFIFQLGHSAVHKLGRLVEQFFSFLLNHITEKMNMR